MRQAIAILILALGFFGWLFYSSREHAGVVCEGCVNFEGRRACAKAAAATRKEALQQVATVACSQLASGMAASIRCTNEIPEEPVCTGEDDPGAADPYAPPEAPDADGASGSVRPVTYEGETRDG